MSKEARPATRLDRECTTFARYLTGCAPDDYLLRAYSDAHARGELAALLASPTTLDRILLAVGSRRVATRMVDVYTALFAKRAVVRKKLVLVLALLESASPSYRYFEEPDSGGVGPIVLRLALRSIGSAFALVSSLVLLAPVHAVLASRGSDRRSR